jgi:hypothetical protein
VVVVVVVAAAAVHCLNVLPRSPLLVVGVGGSLLLILV